MSRNPNKRQCGRAGCRSYAVRGGEFCRSHAPGLPAPNASGAEQGNSNARKHGLYGRYFREDDVQALAVVASKSGLDDEIALTRVAIRRLAERIEEVGDADGVIALSSALFAGAGRVAALLKTQRAISGEAADGIAGAIAQALDELSIEWGATL